MLAEGAFLQLHLEIDRWILKGKKKREKVRELILEERIVKYFLVQNL